MRLKQFFVMIAIALIFCIGNRTPVAAVELPEAEVSTPLALAEALGGDASWVNGNTVTVPTTKRHILLQRAIHIERGEYVLNLNNAQIEIGNYENINITVNGGSIKIMNGEIMAPYAYDEVVFTVNNGNVDIVNMDLYNFFSGGGKTTITASSIGHYYTSSGKSNTVPTAMWIMGGTVLLQGTEANASIYDNVGKAIEYSGGTLTLAEGTRLITLEKEYSSEDIIPKGTIKQAIFVKEEYVTYDTPVQADFRVTYSDEGRIELFGIDSDVKVGNDHIVAIIMAADETIDFENGRYIQSYINKVGDIYKMDVWGTNIFRLRTFKRDRSTGKFLSYSAFVEQRRGQGGTVTDARSLALALGGDDSWVDGNEVTLPCDVVLTNKALEISGDEIILNLNGRDVKTFDHDVVINGGNITIKNGCFRVLAKRYSLVVKSGTLNLIDSYIFRLIASGGNTTVSDCDFVGGMTIDGGRVLLKGTELIRRIGSEGEYGLSYTAGSLETDENTILMTAKGDYDASNLPTKDEVGTVFVAAKDAIAYNDEIETRYDRNGFVEVLGTSGKEVGILSIIAKFKGMSTDADVVFDEVEYCKAIENYKIKVPEDQAYVIIRTYSIQDGKIVGMSKPVELELDTSLYPPREVQLKKDNVVRISWNPSQNGKGYQVYRSTDENGKYIRVANIKDNGITQYVDKTAIMGVKYYYKVRNVIETGENADYSPFCKPLSITASIGVPENLSIKSIDYKRLQISWDQVQGASGYIVYRYTSKDKYKAIATVDGVDNVSFIDTGRLLNKEYSYQIRAFGYIGAKKVYGNYSDSVVGKTLLAIPKVTVKKNTGTSAKITWTKVAGADGYQIYTYDRNLKKYVKLEVVSSDIRTYTAKGLAKGVKHYFKVRAYKKVNGKNVYGSFSEKMAIAF